VSGTRTHCLKLSQLLKALTAFFFFSMAVAFTVWTVMVGKRSLRKVVLGERARMQAQAVPLSVQRALSDSDRDSGDETERKGKKRGKKNPERPKKQSTRPL
jgi:hypothetical protein